MFERRPSDSRIDLSGLRIRSGFSSAVAFSPSDLSGLKFWHGFDDITTLNQISDCGTPVTADADPIGCAVGKGGTIYNATQATAGLRPLYKTGIQNGKSGALLDDTNDMLDFGNSGTPVIPATADWAIYFAVKTPASLSDSKAILAQFLPAAGNGRVLLRYDTSNLALFLGDHTASGQPTASVTFAISTNTAYIGSIRRAGVVFTLRVNGTDRASRTDTGTRSILQTGNLYGARANSGGTYNASLIDFLGGYLFEAVGQVATPSAGDLTNMDTYLNGKYAAY